MYQLVVIADIDDVHKDGKESQELSIKTHYESLDIAESKKVFYVCFSLPGKIINADEKPDHILKSNVNEK